VLKNTAFIELVIQKEKRSLKKHGLKMAHGVEIACRFNKAQD
jgi:hypothetical protein